MLTWLWVGGDVAARAGWLVSRQARRKDRKKEGREGDPVP